MGVDKIADSTKRTNFLGIIIDTSDESGKERGYLFLGVAIVLFVGGLYAIVRPKKVISYPI